MSQKKNSNTALGRFNKTIDWGIVERLCHYQLSQNDICFILKISDDLIRQRCLIEHGMNWTEWYAGASASGKAHMIQLAFKRIQQGDIRLLAKFLESFCGWTPPKRSERDQ